MRAIARLDSAATGVRPGALWSALVAVVCAACSHQVEPWPSPPPPGAWTLELEALALCGAVVVPSWVEPGRDSRNARVRGERAAAEMGALLARCRVRGALVEGAGVELIESGRRHWRIDTVRIDPLGQTPDSVETLLRFELGAAFGILGAPEGWLPHDCRRKPPRPRLGGVAPSWATNPAGGGPWRSAIGVAPWTNHPDQAWRRATLAALRELALETEVLVTAMQQHADTNRFKHDSDLKLEEVDVVLEEVRVLGLHYSESSGNVTVRLGVLRSAAPD